MGLFCKLSHDRSIQAKGDQFRIFGVNSFGEQSTEDFTLDAAPGETILDIADLYENVVHIRTTEAVYELDARNGFVLRKIGTTL